MIKASVVRHVNLLSRKVLSRHSPAAITAQMKPASVLISEASHTGISHSPDGYFQMRAASPGMINLTAFCDVYIPLPLVAGLPVPAGVSAEHMDIDVVFQKDGFSEKT